MMGDNHEEADEHMMEMMGEDFLRQMHIAMGKQSQNSSSFGMMSMMGMMGFGGRNMMGNFKVNPVLSGYRTGFSGVHTVLAMTTWLSLIAFLLAGARWFWKGIRK